MMRPIGKPQTSVLNHFTPRHNPEYIRIIFNSGGSLRSGIESSLYHHVLNSAISLNIIMNRFISLASVVHATMFRLICCLFLRLNHLNSHSFRYAKTINRVIQIMTSLFMHFSPLLSLPLSLSRHLSKHFASSYVPSCNVLQKIVIFLKSWEFAARLIENQPSGEVVTARTIATKTSMGSTRTASLK